MNHHEGEWFLVCDVEPMPANVSTPNGEDMSGIALRLRGHDCAEGQLFPDAEHTWIYVAFPTNVAVRMANGVMLLDMIGDGVVRPWGTTQS